MTPRTAVPAREAGVGRVALVVALAGGPVGAAGGCGRATSSGSARPGATATASVVATAAGVNVAAPASAPGASAAPRRPTAPAATTRAPYRDSDVPPTPEQWDAEADPASLEGAAERGCEGHRLGRWLRVRCRGEADWRPDGVEVTRGGGDGMTFTVVTSGSATLVTPYGEGAALTAAFRFAGADHALRIEWPKNGPEPTTKGRFSSAPAP